MRVRVLSGSAVVLVGNHEKLIGKAQSRAGAFRASPLAPRGAERATAPPAPGNRLHGLACQLINKENFDHGKIRRLRTENGAAFTDENAARIASAMQFSHEVSWRSPRSRVLDSARPTVRSRLAGGCRRRR